VILIRSHASAELRLIGRSREPHALKGELCAPGQIECGERRFQIAPLTGGGKAHEVGGREGTADTLELGAF
jgi:hypothetical protein